MYRYLDVTEAETAAIQVKHPHNYDAQKTQILILWKMKKGKFLGTFRALIEVFYGLGDHRMVDAIGRVANKAYQGPQLTISPYMAC